VEQLAQVVEAVENRQITARDVLKIVFSRFSPRDVTEAVEELVSQPNWQRRDLYRAIIYALRQMEGTVVDLPRNVSMISGEVSRLPAFKGILGAEINAACREIAAASQGGLVYRDNGILVITVALDELERRLSGLTKQPGEPRRSGSFRDGYNPVNRISATS
jgi:hypothetical protein